MPVLSNVLAKVSGSVTEVRERTTALLHFDGPNNSTAIIDSSKVGNTWEAANNVHIDTSQSVFGGASCAFDGTTDFIDGNGYGGMAYGDRDFTWYCRFRLRVVNTAYQIVDTRPNGIISGPYISLEINSSNKLLLFVNGATQILGTTTLVINQWYFLALTRSGSNTRMFLATGATAAQEGPTWTTDTTFYRVGHERPRIGAQGDAGGSSPGRSINGWMDEIHSVTGEALWAAAPFTVPTSAYVVPEEIEILNQTSFETHVNHTFEEGDLLGQANVLTAREYILAPSATENIDFTDLASLFGEDSVINFNRVKLIMVKVAEDSEEVIVGGGGTFAGPFGATSHGVILPPGGVFLIGDILGTGWETVGGSNDILLISCASSVGTATFTLALIGTD